MLFRFDERRNSYKFNYQNESSLDIIQHFGHIDVSAERNDAKIDFKNKKD